MQSLMHNFSRNKTVYIFSLSFFIIYALFLFFVHTPWYTAMQLKFAYKNHNLAVLTRTIDLPSLVSEGYDDTTSDVFTYNSTMPAQTKQGFILLYKLIKKDVCDGTVQMISTYLKNDVWCDPTGTSVLKGRELGIDYDELIERSMLRNTSIRKIGFLTKDDNNNYILPVTVADRYTNTDFILKLQLQKSSDNLWHVAKIMNYHDYLLHVRDLCNTDVASYIKDTKGPIAEYNRKFQTLQVKFQLMTKPIGSTIPQNKRKQVADFINSEVVPAYKSREDYLQNVNVPSGATHLHMFRLQSNAKTMEAWKYFAQGISDGSTGDLAKAESLHQEALVLEQKVSDIISKTPALFTPEIP